MICDFHVHSTVSDGTLDPAELVLAASKERVDCFALTDHDSVDGVAPARRRGAELGIEVMAGVEISVCEDDGAIQMHILGLAVDPESAPLLEGLRSIRDARLTRVDAMLEKLAAAGAPVDRSVLGNGDKAIGRPHVAAALVAAGHCRDENDAFARYLRRGRSAYMASPGIAAVEAFRLIHAAGGIAALAHPPLSVGADGEGGLDSFVARLAPLGLDGLEVQHPSLQPKTRRRLRKLARKHALISTGGSDYHGARKRGISLGRGRGNISVGRETYDAICERAAAYR